VKSGPAQLARYHAEEINPRLCKMQMLQITESLKELQQFLNQKGIPTA